MKKVISDDTFDFSDTEDDTAIPPLASPRPIKYSSPPIKRVGYFSRRHKPHEQTFTIVLVDIHQAAEHRQIECVQKQLYYGDQPEEDDDYSYVALSYRWGELNETLIAATDDYHAHITSFQLLNFYDLCKSISQEPDMAHINYVWVDAICVDQENRERRKATIYRMNDIYKCASWIIAVPDLHSFHLSVSNSANCEIMNTIKKHRVYLYHLLRGSTSQHRLVELDEAWMDSIGLPKNDELRKNLTGYTQYTVEDVMKLDFDSNDHLSIMSSFFSRTDSSQIKENDEAEWLLRHFVTEFRRDHWKRLLHQRQEEIVQSVGFLQSLMEDWSNRTWVISEYHIAKRKNGIMKFWFNQLGCSELHGLPFLEFDFKSPIQPATPQASSHKEFAADHYPFTRRIIYRTRRFNGSMRRRLTKRSFLEMMLETKASRNEDRFHSILPLTPKYKHLIIDGDTIANWAITDMLSVRMKLLEWVDTRDQLNLLISCSPSLNARPLLPSFATCMKTIKHGMARYLHSLQPEMCNFDLDNATSVGVENVERDLTRLRLCPKLYQLPTRRKSARQFYKEIGISNKIWTILGLDVEKDSLVAVSIPIFVNAIETQDPTLNHLLRSDFQLVGNWKKNKWFCYRFCSNYKDCKIYPSQQHLSDPDYGGFHIY